MILTDLENHLRGATLDDVLLTGFIDQDETIARFRSMLGAVYFEFSSNIVEFEVIESTGTMRITCVPAVKHTPALDDDMLAAVTSIREQVLDDSDGRNWVLALRLWGVTIENTGARCCAAQIELANGQAIFVDPTYHFGIRLGGESQKRRWLESWPGASSQNERVLTLSRS